MISSHRRGLGWFAWMVISLVLGIGGSCIPWGSESGLHGVGFPIPVVIWDRSRETGDWRDYPNPLGFIENPVLLFLAGAVLWLLGSAAIFICRKIRGRHPAAG